MRGVAGLDTRPGSGQITPKVASSGRSGSTEEGAAGRTEQTSCGLHAVARGLGFPGYEAGTSRPPVQPLMASRFPFTNCTASSISKFTMLVVAAIPPTLAFSRIAD